MNNEFIKEIKGKEYHFKFKSKKLVDLEKTTGKTILDILQTVSLSNIALLLKYSCLDEVDEYELLDNLLEEMTIEKVVTDVILETCVISGIISKVDLEKIKNAKNDGDSKN